MVGKTMLGAIDAGSNAIRVVIAELGPTELVRIEAERVPIRLGHGAFTRAELDAKTIDQAVAAFVHFRERFDHHAVGMYRAVATSAVRNATNRDVLLHRLYHEAGIELEVIEGEEEARLVRKAVVSALGGVATGGQGGPRAILDLGGGSLEVNLRMGSAWRGTSLPVGTVRLLETFGLDGAIADAEAGMVRRYTATLMQTVPRAPTSVGGIAAATGGNADALAKILGNGAGAGNGSTAPPGFELAALEKALPELVSATVEQRMDKWGLKRDRAEVLGIAALVLATAARQLGIARLVAPGVGVREGVLIELAETAREERARAEGAHDKALLTAARGFANRVDHDTTHGEHVRHLSRALFHQLRDVHGVPDDMGVLLEVAALLHDVGEVVNQRGHHKHSEYMIRWGRIPGLDDAAREMVATMVRVHRKDAARAKQVINDAPIAKDQRVQVRRMAALLRIADGLDSEHRSRVDQVVCTRMGDAIVLDLVVRDGPSRDDAQLLRKADLFKDELGLDVRVTVGRSIATPMVEAAASSGAIPIVAVVPR
jgi:exopolyphosphatase/guanosine-5'-triphosphate,3'-diphosphate pyrophosphatase